MSLLQIAGAMSLIIACHGHILRLTCMSFANFTITSKGKRLVGSSIQKLEGIPLSECKRQCVLNEACKSINYKTDGSEICLLSNGSSVDMMDRVELTAGSQWDFHSTNYSNREVGPNCRLRNPCSSGQMCVDTCSCAGVECLDCSQKIRGFHCNRCASSPCYHGGTCLDLSPQLCNCKAHFTGPFCETEIPTSGDCGAVLTGTNGLIRSPNYPNSYPNQINCKWTIYVTPGNNVRFEFGNLNIEYNTYCNFDYVQIKDGHQLTTTLLTNKLCGTTASQKVYTSSTNVATVLFHTDRSVQWTGFELQWSQV